MKKGIFISLEGPDGSGKSTQIRYIVEYLESRGYETVLTREPGGTSIGEKIRDVILDRENSEMDPMTETMLYAASRAQHVAQVIRPALEQGKVVICDRFVDSSIAYQGFGRDLGDCVAYINEYAIMGCVPDITFLMKLPPEEGIGRIGSGEKDRLESEKISFHQKVYEGYEYLEKTYPGRIRGIDASGSIEEIRAEIEKQLEKLIEDNES
ncbi:MAG: dTMP kinase [Firmicutes bacterium]|nr:dTMP kinase [Bacillota bacterium]MBQ2677853.1 dTMP kinase [Bacillota bacterium]